MQKDRTNFDTRDIIRDIWKSLDLPEDALNEDNISLTGPERTLASSYKLSSISYAAIATSALAASLVRPHSIPGKGITKVSVDSKHAAIEYKSEHLYVLNKQPVGNLWGPISGNYATSDGIIGIHANFPNHAQNALRILGLPLDCTDRDLVAEKVKQYKAIELETLANENGAVIYALRTIDQWNETEQAKALPDFPIIIRKIGEAPIKVSSGLECNDRNGPCLHGIRVAEISRVLAAPICCRTLAAHGADVLWIHGPHLPSLPGLDIDTSRGKRSTFLDLREEDQRNTLKELLFTADVFVQSFRPGAISSKGFSAEEIVNMNPNGIIYASLNAFGEIGPWAGRRGFDSMVQLCSGINASEAEYYGDGSSMKKWPVQALDHTAGYFLAIGILTALHRRITQGGSWEVHVSLAGVMKYITSLGRYPGKSGFEDISYPSSGEAEEIQQYLETRECEMGTLKAVRHAAEIDGVQVGYQLMPEKLGSSEAKWL